MQYNKHINVLCRLYFLSCSYYMTHRLLDTTQGVFIGQNERVDELNTRMYARTAFPALARQFTPIFDLSSTNTKYMHFDDGALPTRVPDIAREIANTSIESNILRDRSRDDATTYVPSTSSDLYGVQCPLGSITDSQPFPLLGNVPTQFATNTRVMNTRNTPIGANIFNNHTQTQMRGYNITKM